MFIIGCLNKHCVQCLNSSTCWEWQQICNTWFNEPAIHLTERSVVKKEVMQAMWKFFWDDHTLWVLRVSYTFYVIYDLFSDAVSVTDYTALSGRFIIERWFGENVEGSDHGLFQGTILALGGKVKVKLSLCLGSGCIDPHFLDLGISWRWVVSFMPLPLYPWVKSPRYSLDRRLVGPQRWSGRHGEVKILASTGTRTPTRSQLLCWLWYPSILPCTFLFPPFKCTCPASCRYYFTKKCHDLYKLWSCLLCDL
jgi:hypothetical protein